MTQNWSKLRAASLDSVTVLRDVLADPAAEDRRLVAAYLETKRLLAAAFEARAAAMYGDRSALDGVRTAIEREMDLAYPSVPASYRKVRGFGTVHARLFAYLSERVGIEVSAAELRMLTGDAVHTERRARELRDLGIHLVARVSGGADTYVLHGTSPDVATAAPALIAKNIRGQRQLDTAEASRLLGLVTPSP
jgi:hypothetical protein